MTTPIQQIVTAELDPLFHMMLAAYHGDAERWNSVTIALRDAMVDHAVSNSPYYTKTIRLGAAFEDLPIVTKRDLREHYEDMVAQNLSEDRRFLQMTSGSTAEPVRFYRDRNALLVDAASDKFCRWLHGIPYDATLVTITSAGRGQQFTRWTRMRDRLRARLTGEPFRDPWLYTTRMVELEPRGVERELATWGKLRSYFLVGHASATDWIADQIEQRGLDLPRRPVGVSTNADQLTELARQRIERVFGAPVHTRYGTTEIRFTGISEPGSTERYLFNPLRVYLEVVDDDGRPLPQGEPGRLLLTDLTNYAMPLIRYDQGDVGILGGYAGGFRVVEHLLGRVPDVLTLPGGKFLNSTTVGNQLFIANDFTPWIRFYQCAQTAPDRLELRVVWRSAPAEDVRRRLADALRAIAEPSTEVVVRDVEELDRLPSGKVWIVRREFA